MPRCRQKGLAKRCRDHNRDRRRRQTGRRFEKCRGKYSSSLQRHWLTAALTERALLLREPVRRHQKGSAVSCSWLHSFVIAAPQRFASRVSSRSPDTERSPQRPCQLEKTNVKKQSCCSAKTCFYGHR